MQRHWGSYHGPGRAPSGTSETCGRGCSGDGTTPWPGAGFWWSCARSERPAPDSSCSLVRCVAARLASAAHVPDGTCRGRVVVWRGRGPGRAAPCGGRAPRALIAWRARAPGRAAAATVRSRPTAAAAAARCADARGRAAAAAAAAWGAAAAGRAAAPAARAGCCCAATGKEEEEEGSGGGHGGSGARRGGGGGYAGRGDRLRSRLSEDGLAQLLRVARAAPDVEGGKGSHGEQGEGGEGQREGAHPLRHRRVLVRRLDRLEARLYAAVGRRAAQAQATGWRRSRPGRGARPPSRG